jgi:hypothetical protein
MNLKDLHDKWLTEKPEGAEHDEVGCPHCNPDLLNDSSTGGGDMKTYTEEEFNAAVQEAVAALQADADSKIADLEAKLQSMTDAANEAEVLGEVAKVQAELDKAEIRVAEAEKRYNDFVAYLQAEADAAAEAASIAEKRESRRAAMSEHTSLSDEKIEERLDLWVAMADEVFEAHLEDLKAVSAASRETEEETPQIRETAMSNVRESDSVHSAAADVFGARNAGINIRTI